MSKTKTILATMIITNVYRSACVVEALTRSRKTFYIKY